MKKKYITSEQIAELQSLRNDLVTQRDKCDDDKKEAYGAAIRTFDAAMIIANVHLEGMFDQLRGI